MKHNAYPNIRLGSNIRSRKLLAIYGEVLINAPVEKVWKALTQPNHVSYFNPFVELHECPTLSKIGHKDACIYYNGRKLFRELVIFEPEKKVRFKVQFEDRKPKNNHTMFEISPIDENSTQFRLTIDTDAFKNIPRPIWHALAYFFIVPNLKKYVEAVVSGMKYYNETENKVAKNMFGKVKKFTN